MKTAYITNKQGTAAENDEIGLWTRLNDMRGVKVYCKKKDNVSKHKIPTELYNA